MSMPVAVAESAVVAESAAMAVAVLQTLAAVAEAREKANRPDAEVWQEQ